jgi:hypothetical protein
MDRVAFYRAASSWIKHDVHKLITNFYINGNSCASLNATEIVLIPKKGPSHYVTDFFWFMCSVHLSYLTVLFLSDNSIFSLTVNQRRELLACKRITNKITIAQEIVHSFNLKSINHHAFVLNV